MCSPKRNGTIYKGCRERIFAIAETRHVRRREILRILRLHGGCMVKSNHQFDNYRRGLLISS